MAKFGKGFNEFWTGTIGHDIRYLTEAEGAYLEEWSDDAEATKGCSTGSELLQRLRDKLDEAAAKNGQC